MQGFRTEAVVARRVLENECARTINAVSSIRRLRAARDALRAALPPRTDDRSTSAVKMEPRDDGMFSSQSPVQDKKKGVLALSPSCGTHSKVSQSVCKDSMSAPFLPPSPAASASTSVTRRLSPLVNFSLPSPLASPSLVVPNFPPVATPALSAYHPSLPPSDSRPLLPHRAMGSASTSSMSLPTRLPAVFSYPKSQPADPLSCPPNARKRKRTPTNAAQIRIRIEHSRLPANHP
ncbi:hypothetical protein DFH07DRAFT_505780 [Mycena maculata]|uniref:Uncharacterized protein n=1 Tax=Mycena maculata TaxID=230809 RepID=A0AAD7IZL1_9AGAR|nr:hypothetical protein DFH07DRAFT_505780 [Mycena maculata]